MGQKSRYVRDNVGHWNINRFNLKSKQMEAEDKYRVFYLDANFL